MIGRGHVGSTRGNWPRTAPPAAARAVAVVLAAAHHAYVTHRVRADRPRLRPGPHRLGTSQHSAAARQPAAVRRTAGRRGALHRGDAAARPADRGVPGPALRMVAAARPPAPAPVRPARAVPPRRGAASPGPPDPGLPPRVPLR